MYSLNTCQLFVNNSFQKLSLFLSFFKLFSSISNYKLKYKNIANDHKIIKHTLLFSHTTNEWFNQIKLILTKQLRNVLETLQQPIEAKGYVRFQDIRVKPQQVPHAFIRQTFWNIFVIFWSFWMYYTIINNISDWNEGTFKWSN